MIIRIGRPSATDHRQRKVIATTRQRRGDIDHRHAVVCEPEVKLNVPLIGRRLQRPHRLRRTAEQPAGEIGIRQDTIGQRTGGLSRRQPTVNAQQPRLAKFAGVEAALDRLNRRQKAPRMGWHQQRGRLAKRGEITAGCASKNRITKRRSRLGQATGCCLIGGDDDGIKHVRLIGKQLLRRSCFRHLAKRLAGAAGIQRRECRPRRAVQPGAKCAVSLRRFG